MNYSELLQLAKGWSNFKFYRIIIWRLLIKDYMESKNNLKTILEEYAKQFPDINIDIITPHERYIQEFLESFIAINN